MLEDHITTLLADVNAIATQPGTPQVAERPRHYLEAIALYDRCRGLFGAVRLLVRGGFGQEALILTRPMFTESLMLLELAASDEPRRMNLLLGWSLASTDDLIGVMREAQGRGQDATEPLEALEAKKASIERYARRNNARTRRWNVNEKELADKHLDGEGYLDFRIAHHFVHGTTFAGEQRYAAQGDTVLVGHPTATGQDPWARNAALTAAQSMLFATRGICGVLGWPEPLELPGLVERLEQIALETGAENSGAAS